MAPGSMGRSPYNPLEKPTISAGILQNHESLNLMAYVPS